MDGRPSTLWLFSPQSSFLLANALKLWSFAHQCQIHCPSYSQSSIFSIPHPPVLCMSTNAPCCSPSGILVCGSVWARALYKHQNLFFFSHCSEWTAGRRWGLLNLKNPVEQKLSPGFSTCSCNHIIPMIIYSFLKGCTGFFMRLHSLE